MANATRATDYSKRYLQAEAVRLARSFGRRCRDWAVVVRNNGCVTLRVMLGDELKRKPKGAAVASAVDLDFDVRVAL